jgi:hypothetical protein
MSGLNDTDERTTGGPKNGADSEFSLEGCQGSGKRMCYIPFRRFSSHAVQNNEIQIIPF